MVEVMAQAHRGWFEAQPAMSDAADAIPLEAEESVTGQLVKVRTLSAKLAFADLVLSAQPHNGTTDGPAADGETIELVLKQSPALPSVKDALKAMKLGDILRIAGYFERSDSTARDHRTFRCCGLPVVVEAWDARGLRGPFEPVFTMCLPCSEKAPPPSASGTATMPLHEDLCKHYTSEGRCPIPRCPRVHTDDPAVRRGWLAEKRRRAAEAERAVVGGPSRCIEDTASRAQRAGAFAAFLCETFDLTSESTVLDVAGGRGDLCFELSALRGIPCVSVDPRGRKLNRRQRRFLKERQTDVPEGPRGDLWGGHVRTLFHADFFHSNDAAKSELRNRVTVLAGLHPDEATEHIVDCALERRIPFAVVPCCVFPRDGRSMSFQEWCDHLEAKDGMIRREYLDCRGKNLVLYCTF
ncbi:hypothetical protein ACHAXT_002744 [Thalassiosira profunda]